ncbi:MAG: hypothetical protein M1827_006516 [Pycnora praestabilis]|nr:MAG: hypothetical protein M1827_006516 [Pycnora praestabilis]
MAYGYPGVEYFDPYDPLAVPHVRPGRYRQRMTSESYNQGQNVYMTRSGHLMAPAGGYGGGMDSPLHRTQSANGPRPEINIINTMREDYSPIGRGRRPVIDEDDYEWDTRAHSPGYREHHRSHSRARASTYGSREPSPHYEYWRQEQQLEQERKFKELEEFQKTKEEEARSKKIKEDLLLKQALEAEKKREEAEKEKKLKEKAIEEWKVKEQEKKAKEKEAKEKADKEYIERFSKDLAKLGIEQRQIDTIIRREKEPAVLDVGRKTTFIKVHRKHLSVETLDAYQLPWEWDVFEPNYIIIKRWIPEHQQQMLFEHTRRLREERERDIMVIHEQTKKEANKNTIVRKKRRPSPAKVGLLDLFTR